MCHAANQVQEDPCPFRSGTDFARHHQSSVQLQPGSLVQVSGWIRITEAIKASHDGALFYDSVGGEPLAIRLTEPTPWKKVTFYRRVPSSGNISVTLALTGIGAVYFDDVRIEPLVSGGDSSTVQATR